ncbi:MAG: type II toxin-antitoxin system VapC family toxin [Gemmataceae bacterium]
MTAADPFLVDTNVLIYHQIALSPFHAAARSQLRDLFVAGNPLWLSRQILREYLAAMSRPGTLTPPLPMTTLIADVQTFASRFLIAEDGSTVTVHLLSLLASISCSGKQVHDANIVATMLARGIPRLLTHNVADFSRFAGVITVVPLVP